MKSSFAQWCSKHPYTVTSLIFLVVIVLGWRSLGWGERHLGFVLLLYFIVTLGVRLDEITRSIGGPSVNPHARAGDADTVIAHLREIKELLRRIDSKLPRPAPDDDRAPRP
jgi:hypothetical protein